MSEKPPEILGVAVILPVPREVVASVDCVETDPEVEAVAIETAKQYEASQGRKAVSVEEDNCGWDLTSLLEGQVARYIEVKGRAGTGGVALTPNEWIKAQRFGKDYWLYIVTNCRSTPELHMIQDPASKLSPREEVSVVRYMVETGGLEKGGRTRTTKGTMSTKGSMVRYDPIPAHDEQVAKTVIGAAIEVHRALGPGFLESIYRKALAYELSLQGVPVEQEKEIVVPYKDIQIPGQRLDLLAGGLVVVELKCVEQFAPIHQAQLISYLKATGLRLGLLINFKVSLLKDGIQRIVR